MLPRGVAVLAFILVNIPQYIFETSDGLFAVTKYVCTFDPSVVLFERTGVIEGRCALLCQLDNRCFSFQYNKQSKHCYTTTWNVYGIETCNIASNDNEVAYIKGKGFSIVTREV